MFARPMTKFADFHHSLFAFEAQFLVEGLCTWFASKEVLEGLHFLLTATSFQNSVTVSTTFLAIHRVLFEEGVE